MRFRGERIGAALLVLLVALAGVAVANAKGRAGLDTSYGEGGVASVSVPEPAGPGAEGPYADAYAFAAADDGSAYMLGNLRSCGSHCRDGRFLVRVDSDGRPDASFAGDGRLELPPGFDYTVLVDPAGRAVIADLQADRHTVVIRRFKVDGSLDRGFGKAGAVKVSCPRCGERFIGLRLLRSPGGRVLLDVNAPESHRQSQVRLFRFRSNGAPDTSFGRAGSATFAARPSLPRAVSVAADGSVLIAGAGCCDANHIYVERVGADGTLDRRFDRTVAHSVGRLSRPGESLTVGAIVPWPGGGLVALGGSKGNHGYYLRLNRDGGLAIGFGKRGLVRLPHAVLSAVPGLGGAVFAVGQAKSYGYIAFRVLSDGRLDPAYGGAAGLRVPLAGSPARAIGAGPGRVLVSDKGNAFCREACRSHPAISRFLE
jgi:uncharacterized delta-60 repeat protein